MQLSTTKQYVFQLPNGKLTVQSSAVKTKPHKTLETKVWVSVVNYLDQGKGPKKISVKAFNKLKMKLVGEL